MREFCHLACFQPVALAIPIHSRRSERERSNALLAHALRIGPRGAAGKAQEVCYVRFVSRQDTQDATSRMQRRVQIDGARFWHPKGLKVAQVVEEASAKTGIPMAKLAIAWPLGRRFVTSVVVGVRTREQMMSNLEPGDWDMPEDVWKTLEEQTRPEEEYLTWFNRKSYERFFAAADFHDERAELP